MSGVLMSFSIFTQTIEGLGYNKTLEHLNLSGNYISHVNDLSVLKNLKVSSDLFI